ncbi:hypothetical protein CCACVL1_10729 [Corchorus capsularis]|uniref:HTH myb-type domain-containing protein n=1 Tax=Corchorus capsularis TaxID=210143 RepID=A0A1R3IQ23_COCAP|nr:hypothetical protein CCACVL1_10729 [Corchorus capsularis]
MGGVAWTEEEDHLLKKCIKQYGEGKWHRVPLLAETDQGQENAMNSDIIRAEPRGNIGTTAGSIMKPRSRDMVPDSSRQQAGIMEESSMSSTPFNNYVEFDQQGQEIVKEEDCGIGNLEEPASVGEYLAKDFGEFDQVNILNSAATDAGCSKWEWEDLILDMDLWTDSL